MNGCKFWMLFNTAHQSRHCPIDLSCLGIINMHLRLAVFNTVAEKRTGKAEEESESLH